MKPGGPTSPRHPNVAPEPQKPAESPRKKDTASPNGYGQDSIETRPHAIITHESDSATPTQAAIIAPKKQKKVKAAPAAPPLPEAELKPTFAAPQFRPYRGVAAPFAGDVVRAKLADMVQQHMSKYSYNRLVHIMGYRQHLEEARKRQPDVTPAQALQTFVPDGRALVDTHFGGHCGDLSQALARQLPPELPGYVVGSTVPSHCRQKGMPAYCHAAVVVPFKSPDDDMDEGYVLLEPGFFVSEPLVVRRDERQPFLRHPRAKLQELWELDTQGHAIKYQRMPKDHPLDKAVPKEFEDQTCRYNLDELVNPDACISPALLAIDRVPSMIRRSEDGRMLLKLKFDLDKTKMWMTTSEMTDERGVDFAALLDPTKPVDGIDVFAEMFGLSEAQLMTNIRDLIAFAPTLAKVAKLCGLRVKKALLEASSSASQETT